MKRFKLNSILFFFIGFLFFTGNFCAFAKGSKKAETPTRIRSDIIDIKRKSQTINFINNVVVEKDDSSLLANKMIVIYEEKKDGEDDAKIKIIEAHENVKIFTDEFIASGDSGYFDPNNNNFTLEKNVVVNNGTSIANGDKFIYDLNTKKGKFIGESNQSIVKDQNLDKRVTIIIGDDAKKEKNKNDK